MHGAAQTTGHGHGHGHEYGISATPVADTTTAPAANSRLCRASQFHFHGANTAARVAEIWAVGSYGCFGGRDLHSASQFVFPKSAGAQPRTRTRIRMRIRIRTRLRPTRTANDNAAQWEETYFYWTKLKSLLFSNYLASYRRYFNGDPSHYVCAILSSIRRAKY